MMDNYNPIQALVDAMSKKHNAERAETQMTLGKLIDELKTLEPECSIMGLGEEDSYRGYYSDLAFSPIDETQTIQDLLEQCQGAMGRTYEGYKGGDYIMHENTPLWISEYGTASGIRIMGLDLQTNPITVLVEKEQW